MPIDKLPSRLYEVANIRFGYNARGERYITWDRSGDADAYVICMVRGTPVEEADLAGCLGEAKLAQLYKSMQVDVQLEDGRTCALHGVSSRIFDDDPLVVVEADAPMLAQVWTMKKSYATYCLFLPQDAQSQCCLLPTEYDVSFFAGNPQAKSVDDRLSVLKVSIENEAEYENGALEYQVGDSAPVPIPRRWINQQIPLMIGDANPRVAVRPSQGHDAAYVRRQQS